MMSNWTYMCLQKLFLNKLFRFVYFFSSQFFVLGLDWFNLDSLWLMMRSITLQRISNYEILSNWILSDSIARNCDRVSFFFFVNFFSRFFSKNLRYIFQIWNLVSFNLQQIYNLACSLYEVKSGNSFHKFSFVVSNWKTAQRSVFLELKLQIQTHNWNELTHLCTDTHLHEYKCAHLFIYIWIWHNKQDVVKDWTSSSVIEFVDLKVVFDNVSVTDGVRLFLTFWRTLTGCLDGHGRVWPKPTLAKTDFGQSDFGQTDFDLFFVCVCVCVCLCVSRFPCGGFKVFVCHVRCSRDRPSRDRPSRDRPSRDRPSRDGRDQLWPIPFWPSWFDQFWPIQFWPIHFSIVVLARPILKANFGQSNILANPILANPIRDNLFWSGVCHGGAPEGGQTQKRWGPRRVGPRRVGPRRVGAQNFALFFPSPAGNFIFSFLSGGSSRGILVVFEAPGHSNVRVWSSLVVVWSLGGPKSPNEHIWGSRSSKTPPKFNEKDQKRGRKE